MLRGRFDDGHRRYHRGFDRIAIVAPQMAGTLSSPHHDRALLQYLIKAATPPPRSPMLVCLHKKLSITLVIIDPPLVFLVDCGAYYTRFFWEVKRRHRKEHLGTP